MKIRHLEFWPVKMRLVEPYTIAYERIESSTNVFLRIVTNQGVIGYGCAAPDVQVTGETAETVMNICTEYLEPALKGSDPLRYALLLERLKPILNTNPSAVAMADMALYDILGKVSGLAVYNLLGGFRTRIKTSITIVDSIIIT